MFGLNKDLKSTATIDSAGNLEETTTESILMNMISGVIKGSNEYIMNGEIILLPV